MNILNFNNGVSAVDFDEIGLRKSCAMAPVFFGKEVYEGRNDPAKVLPIRNEYFCDRVALPFPELRIWLDIQDTQYHGLKSFCQSENDGREFRVMSFAVGKRVPTKGWATHTTRDKLFHGFYEHGRWIKEDELEMASASAKESAKGYALRFFDSVTLFLNEVNSPSNFIATARPDTRGKSAQWMAARTHYVVLHKTHPANSEAVSSGASVKETEKYVKRQAHSRRAHYRILRSPLFKNKCGQRIWIKSTWVGPKEWKQASSIYRLHEPVQT